MCDRLRRGRMKAAVPESWKRHSDEQSLGMNFWVCISKLNWCPIMFPTTTSQGSSCEQHQLALSRLARYEAEKPRTSKEMSLGGRSQPLEWAMVHTLAWKHDIAEGGKTPFYHSVRFTPSLPVKHAICPRHRSSCWLIECDRAIHTLLPIRHHLLRKKVSTTAQWQAVRQRASTSTGPWLGERLSKTTGYGEWPSSGTHCNPSHAFPSLFNSQQGLAQIQHVYIEVTEKVALNFADTVYIYSLHPMQRVLLILWGCVEKIKWAIAKTKLWSNTYTRTYNKWWVLEIFPKKL